MKRLVVLFAYVLWRLMSLGRVGTTLYGDDEDPEDYPDGE